MFYFRFVSIVLKSVIILYIIRMHRTCVKLFVGNDVLSRYF